MSPAQIYILIGIVALLIAALLVFGFNRGARISRITPLTGLAFGCILAGILFGENRAFGYGLLGLGVLLSILDVFNKARKP
jgi:hypothetical protein